MGNYKVKKEDLEQVFEYTENALWRKPYTDSDGYVRKRKLVKNTANNSDGYCTVSFKYGTLKYHTIVWTLNYGDIPKNMVIDHINGNRIDNRLENLRLVDYRQNANNTYKNRNGRLFGCFFEKSVKKWRSQTYINGKRIHIGLFNTELEAHEAYKNFLISAELGV